MILSDNEGLNWWGWGFYGSGYGKMNLEYSCALERVTGGKVSVGWERKTPDEKNPDWVALSEEQKQLWGVKPFKPEKIGIIKTTPPVFKENRSQYRIGYTMIENTVIGKDWVKLCNEMDAIFVPSKYMVPIFQENGVTKPIRVVKQGINPNKFPYLVRNKKPTFVFGTTSFVDDRKNWQALIRAFASEFSPEEPVELWIKNSNPNWGFHQPIDKRIKYIHTMYTEPELLKFYQLLDCFVFPSKAEGAGMPPREAMATGLPVIMTNWSGLSDVCDSKFNYPIDPVAIDEPDGRNDPAQPGFQARIDIAELMYWMRYVYEHQEEAKAKGKLASDWMMNDWNWDACARDMLKQIESL